MDAVLQYIVSFLPTIVALIGEISVIAKVISIFKKTKETDEFKKVCQMNAQLIQELREAKKLNKELLTKIDHIERGE